MLKSRTTVALAGIFVGVFAVGDALANCTGKWPLRWTMPISSSHYGQSLKNVLSKNGFFRAGSVRNNDNRLSFVKTPGGTPGIRMKVPKGENKIVSFDTNPLKAPGAEKACISVDVYFSKGFSWAEAGTKLGIGLWGGDTDSNNSGGIPPNKQEGWSVRVLNSKWGARAYGYHLNRPGNYGDALGSYGKMKIGSWNNIQVEVQMNTVGSANGSLRMWVNGRQTVYKTGLRWRKKSSWAIRGLKFTDMWGGNTAARVNHSPRSQEMFYRNFKIYGDGGSSSSRSGGSLASTSSTVKVSGSFAPVFPSRGAKVKPISEITWKSETRADRYYIRIIDRKTLKTRIAQTVKAYEIGCFGGGNLCKISYNGPKLSNGTHRMVLRSVANGKKIKEYTFDFTVASNGTSSGTVNVSQSSSNSGSGATSSSGNSSVSAKAPSGSTSDRTPSLTWTGNSSEYYIKVVNDSKKTVFARRISASAAKCNKDSNCTFTLPSVKADTYKWSVRGVDNGRQTAYSTLQVKIR